MSKKEVRKTQEGVELFKLYEEDPELADRVIFGRVPHQDRRGFLRGAGLAAMGAVVGATIPFHRSMPSGFIPVAMVQTPGAITGKDGLTVYNDRPVNA